MPRRSERGGEASPEVMAGSGGHPKIQEGSRGPPKVLRTVGRQPLRCRKGCELSKRPGSPPPKVQRDR